jgi:hypothetical protein
LRAINGNEKQDLNALKQMYPSAELYPAIFNVTLGTNFILMQMAKESSLYTFNVKKLP